MIKRWAIIRTQKEGFHCWPDAPEPHSFLRNIHRHIFHIEVWVEQKHNERDIEYIAFKHHMEICFEAVLRMNFKIGETMSCETIAEELIKLIQRIYSRDLRVFVFEDNENGCCLEFVNEQNSNHD